MQILVGNTYEHRELIKSRGGMWQNDIKRWKVPVQHYAELQALCIKPGSETNKKTCYVETREYRYENGVRQPRFKCLECREYVYAGSECCETGSKH